MVSQNNEITFYSIFITKQMIFISDEASDEIISCEAAEIHVDWSKLVSCHCQKLSLFHINQIWLYDHAVF